MVGFIWLCILGSVIWVGIDASNLGMQRGKLGGGSLDMGVASWVVCCLLLWIVAFPCYLVARGKYKAMTPHAAWQQPAWDAPQTYGAPPQVQYAPPQFQVAPVQQAAPVVPAAPPQLSPDGHWWWTGEAWVPAQR